MRRTIQPYYQNKIAKEIDGRANDGLPLLSVVIVTYNKPKELLSNLKSLEKQTVKQFEVLIGDNGEKTIPPQRLASFDLETIYIKLKRNYGPSIARNACAQFARAPIICFLDDDAVAKGNWVETHYSMHNQKQILTLTGRIFEKSKNIYNSFQQHYDLGEKILEMYIKLEGNCSIRKDVFDAVGGFNPDIFGAEGVDLSYRILKRFGNRDRMIYHPDAIIYHDFATNFFDYIKKRIRHIRMKKKISELYPDMINFKKTYPVVDAEKIGKANQYSFRKTSLLKLTRLILRFYKLIQKSKTFIHSKQP